MPAKRTALLCAAIATTCLATFIVSPLCMLAVASEQPKPESTIPEAGKVDAQAAFEKVKSLAGKWAGKTAHGDGSLEFRITAAGSAVAETMWPGSPYEMVNMYSIDGGELFLVHYCGMGNQPRMKLIAVEGDTLKFSAVSVANKSGPDASYMHSLDLTIAGDTIKEKWGHLAEGKVETHAEFELKKQQ